MNKNVGTNDKIIRILLATAVGVLWYMGKISGTVAIVLGVGAAVFLLTSVINFCPLYALLGISTAKK